MCHGQRKERMVAGKFQLGESCCFNRERGELAKLRLKLQRFTNRAIKIYFQRIHAKKGKLNHRNSMARTVETSEVQRTCLLILHFRYNSWTNEEMEME